MAGSAMLTWVRNQLKLKHGKRPEMSVVSDSQSHTQTKINEQKIVNIDVQL